MMFITWNMYGKEVGSLVFTTSVVYFTLNLLRFIFFEIMFVMFI